MTLRPIGQGAPAPSRRRRNRLLVGLAGVAVVLVGGLLAVLTAWSGATLSSDPSALARVKLQPFAGTLTRAEAFAPDGRSIALAVEAGRLTPLTQITPGELISVEVVIRRPGWLSWALGSVRRERLTLRAPVARVTEPWVTVAAGSPVPITFDQPVSAVAYGPAGGPAAHLSLSGARRTVALPGQAGAGTTEVAAAVHPWEKLSAPATVTWFPPSRSPVLLASPAPGSELSPAAAIRLTFSDPVAAVLGSSLPQLSPSTPGSCNCSHGRTATSGATVVDAENERGHRPFGAPLGAELSVVLPHPVALAEASGRLAPASEQISWTVPPGSTLRLQQLLAQQGYLPVV